jgi:hypothetical protein
LCIVAFVHLLIQILTCFFLVVLFRLSFFLHADEPEYWWFELMILFNKTMMCGGLVVLAPGSPVQVMFAILIMQLHLLFLLKLAPYVKDSEDWSSFFATLGLCLMSLGALMMMKVQDDEATSIGLATTALPIVCIVIVLGIMIMYDFGLKQRCCGGSREASSKNVKKTSSTQVQPINTNNETMLDVHGRTAQQQEDHQILRNWGTNKPTQVATPASAHY